MLNPEPLPHPRTRGHRASIDALTPKVRAQLEMHPQGGALLVYLQSLHPHKGVAMGGNGDGALPVPPEPFARLTAGEDLQRLTDRPAQAWERQAKSFKTRQPHGVPGRALLRG